MSRKKKQQLNYYDKLPTRIRELKDANNDTQQDIADLINVSRQSVSAYETGDMIPDALAIKLLAERYKVSADYLLGITDSATTDPQISDAAKLTGLSDNAIKTLATISKHNDVYAEALRFLINKVLEEYDYDDFLTNGDGDITLISDTIFSKMGMFIMAASYEEYNDTNLYSYHIDSNPDHCEYIPITKLYATNKLREIEEWLYEQKRKYEEKHIATFPKDCDFTLISLTREELD